MSIIKNILQIIGMIISIFCGLLGLLLFVIGMVEAIPSMAVCGIIILAVSILGSIFIGKRIPKLLRTKKHNKINMVTEDTTITDPLYLQISPEDKLKLLKIAEPGISLYEGEFCYYRNLAYAIHKNKSSEDFFEATLYITNIRFILLAPKYGFDVYISKITQLLYMDYGFQIFVGSKCYSVLTTDEYDRYIFDFIEFMNSQGVFKDEKWLKEQQKHINSTNSTTLNIKQELSDLKWLIDEGIITQEEFDAKKKQLLGL